MPSRNPAPEVDAVDHRERTARDATAVPMRDLLAACAAAATLCTPPVHEADADRPARADERTRAR